MIGAANFSFPSFAGFVGFVKRSSVLGIDPSSAADLASGSRRYRALGGPD